MLYRQQDSEVFEIKKAHSKDSGLIPMKNQTINVNS